MGKVKATFHLLNGSTVNSWYTQERARYLVTHPATGWNAECNADTGTVHVIPANAIEFIEYEGFEGGVGFVCDYDGQRL